MFCLATMNIEFKLSFDIYFCLGILTIPFNLLSTLRTHYMQGMPTSILCCLLFIFSPLLSKPSHQLCLCGHVLLLKKHLKR